MKSQKKWLVGTIVILLLINIITIGSFWWLKRPKHPPKLEHFFKKELALSEKQVAEFERLGQLHREKGKEMHTSIKTHKNMFFTEMLSKNPNQQTIDSLSNLISELQTKMDQNLINHFNELKTVCDSEEQEEKLRKVFIKSFKKRHRQPKR